MYTDYNLVEWYKAFPSFKIKYSDDTKNRKRNALQRGVINFYLEIIKKLL